MSKMKASESYVLSVLRRYSQNGEWRFFELFDDNGKSEPQAKDYGSGFVSYPDFEFYYDEKLMLLVEVKGYNGFFDNETGKVAMKYRCYKSYRQVRMKEDVDVRICFSIVFANGEKVIFWDSIDNISKYPKYVKSRTYAEYSHKLKRVVEKKDDFVYWNVEDFRTDEENIPVV